LMIGQKFCGLFWHFQHNADVNYRRG
jgi:hypothetical protein